ncbi:MAG: SLBB domain-containing protein, partial [Gemmatimonadales bacterium]|nr:SLBB domain-containing protein [Gemmatimonadales bacterium]
RPPGVTDQQIQQGIEQRGLGDQLRQRIQQSGMTPDQIRARLRAAGYSDNLIDSYLGQATPGQATPAPTVDMLRAAAALGFADFALADTLRAPRDSLIMSRADSFLLDTLGFVAGQDSIPTRRDEFGALRVDTAGVRVMAERLRRARIFGLDVFRRTTNQFAPVTSGPVDPEYRIGPGDDLALILTGDVELAHQLPVSREGFVVVPQVGQIQVANLTMGQLRSLLYARLGRVYSGVRRGPNATTQFDLTVSRVRVNQIFVTGDVVRPGAYAVSALGTVMNALYQAGGPTERGGFRRIRVMRSGEAVDTLDVYDYLLNGNTRGDIRLESGDVVFVPPHGPRVTLEGPVLRPAIYELAPGQGLKELIQMAGGLLPEAYTGRANIERVLPPDQRLPDGRDRTALDVDLGAALRAGAPPVVLAGNDRLRVFSVTRPVRNRVLLSGNVWRPGTYELQSGMTLSQAIAAASGLKTDTYAGRAHILRLMPDSTRRLLAVDLSQIVDAAAMSGGAGTGASRPMSRAGADPELREFDEITIYSRTEFRPYRQIAVYGSVQRPGLYTFRDSMSLRDAVIMAGGLRDDAYLLEAEIARIPETRRGGELATIQRVPLDSTYVVDPTGYLRRETPARGAEHQLQPYDNVFIRRVPGFELQRNVVLSGEVRFPGRYTLTNREERLGDLITRAGGVTDAAYVRGAQFYRTQGNLGRVGIDFERVLRDPSFRDNMILFAGDSLFVPEYQPTVRVEGEVNSPVTVAYRPGAGVGYYVDAAGG